jgi:hypothetical protein
VPIKSERGKLNKTERKEFLRHVDYMERVEKMRPYFGDMFKAKSGYDLHKVDEWSPAMKKRVTDYFRIMAPRLESDNVAVKRYRRKDHLDSAIIASLQEKPLKGQKAAIFTLPRGVEKVNVRFTKKRGAVVDQQGIAESTLLFNKANFLEDWKSEVDRVLDQVPDVRLFRIIKGANKSDVLTRDDIYDEIANIIELYSSDEMAEGTYDKRWFGEWLNGLVAYEGLTIRQMQAQDRRRKEDARAREKRRAQLRRKKTKLVSGRGLRKQQMQQRGKALKRGELTTGRKGRVK